MSVNKDMTWIGRNNTKIKNELCLFLGLTQASEMKVWAQTITVIYRR